jgi:hypothetical protein
MIKKIILIEDNSRLIEEIINDRTIQLENVMTFIFSNVEQIQDAVKLNTLVNDEL